MKIDDREIRELMRLALQSRIDKNDLTGTEKANILYFARQDKLNELEFLHRLVIANPKQNFEKLVSYSTRLKDCDILINWLEPYQQDQPQKKTPGPITYQWTKQADIQLPILHQKLIDGGFIASETSSETFTACFTGQPVKSVTEKLHWLESKVLLAYFLDCLISLEKMPKKTKLWSIAEKVFIDAANLKQAKANFISYGYPDGYERIDKILTDL